MEGREHFGASPVQTMFRDLEALAAYKRRLDVRSIQEKILLDEYDSLPVSDRLAANYWHLRATASPLAIAAHQRGL